MIEPSNIKKIADKFFSDPDWVLVEELILDYIEPLQDMSTVDVTQPAEHVKAEIIGRNKAYQSLDKFLRDSKVIRQRSKPQIKNIFN